MPAYGTVQQNSGRIHCAGPLERDPRALTPRTLHKKACHVAQTLGFSYQFGHLVAKGSDVLSTLIYSGSKSPSSEELKGFYVPEQATGFVDMLILMNKAALST